MEEREMLDNFFDNFKAWSNQFMRGFKDFKLIEEVVKYEFDKFIRFVFCNLLNAFLYSFEKSKFLLFFDSLGVKLFHIF